MTEKLNSTKVQKRDKKMKNYTVHTDLACEAELSHDACKNGVDYTEEIISDFKVARLNVKNDVGEQTTMKKKGKYITVFSKMISDIDEEEIEKLSEVVSGEIIALSKELLKGESPSCVLVAGLGNREITADNIGPKTVDRLTVTRHLKIHAANIFKSYFSVPVCAIAPGVLGQTGIETAELIDGVCKCVSPNLVIVIDALAARSTSRLGSTVQISDSGIHPGSGIGNKRNEISKRTLGIPVIAIGVPTVVNSSTLVYDALLSAGCTELVPEIETVLSQGESFFVSPRQSDKISDCVSSLLANSIDKMFLT